MIKQQYLDSLVNKSTAIVNIFKEAQKENGDKIYRVDLRNVINGEVLYSQVRFVVLNEGLTSEMALNLKDE